MPEYVTPKRMEKMELYPFYHIDPRILKAGEETMAEAAGAL